MISSLRRLRFAAPVWLLAMASGAWAQSEPLIAGKAVVNLSLTITQTIGGYALTPLKWEAEALKEIHYGEAMDPLDFDAEAAGFTYWSERTNTVHKKLADGDVYPVETITRIVRKALVQRYLTANFIKDLIARGGVLDESPSDALAWKGYGLVAVSFKGFDEDRRFFFAEKTGKTPVFLGWEKRAGEAAPLTAGMCLLTEMSAGEAETGTRVESQKITYTVFGAGDSTFVEEDILNPPSPTATETFTGKAPISVLIFPNGTGPFRDLRIAGKATYSGRHDTKKDVRVNGKVSASGLTGSQFVEELPEATVEGTFTIGAEKLLKIEPEGEAEMYWAALPESLRF